MQTHHLWASWRMQYISQLDAPAGNTDGPPAPPGCFLCDAAQVALDSPQAKELLVLHRDAVGVIMLNRYPYTTGHLLVACIGHVGDLTDLPAPQRAGMMELVALAQQIVRHAFNPQGMNIGMNLGRCAGAGFPGHLHIHIVPRWNGDINFMSTVGHVRVVPQALEVSYDQLAAALAKVLRK